MGLVLGNDIDQVTFHDECSSAGNEDEIGAGDGNRTHVSSWEATVLPLNYTRARVRQIADRE